ncbi:MAG: class I SAM-dependent methyltransferase [Pseudonocardiaceae bacterium]
MKYVGRTVVYGRGQLRHIMRSIRAVRVGFVRPPWVSPGHYYSPISSAEDVDRALSWPAEAPGVDLRAEAQVSLMRELDLSPPVGPRWSMRESNTMYGCADSTIYAAILRRFRPHAVVEVGSGFSTAVLLDVAAADKFETAVTCIEPYPKRLESILVPEDNVTLLRQPVQEVPVSHFELLRAGDVIFIDSTHVAKAGSDVCWLLLRVLPLLSPGVLVHVHDIFWPFTYPESWLREGRDWNESYLLNALLIDTMRWEIVLFSSWLWQNRIDLVPLNLRNEQPGSIWIRRT